MKWKKVIAILIVLALLAGTAVGGVFGYKSYQNKKLVAEVQTVSALNVGYWMDEETSYGTVTNDSAQEVYMEDSDKVEEIYVQEGDSVKAGDPLVRYDTSGVEVEIKRKELEMSTLGNNISVAKRELEKLKQTVPVEKDKLKEELSNFDRFEDFDEFEDLEEDIPSIPEKDEKDSRIYNYVTEDSVPYNVDTADGTEERPYIYYCNKGAYAYGSFYNSIRPSDGEDGKHVLFIICKKDANGRMQMETLQEPEEPETSEKPEEPEASEKPEEPEASEKPESSEKPEEPEASEKPEEPEASEKPEEPEASEKPEEPEASEEPEESVTIEQREVSMSRTAAAKEIPVVDSEIANNPLNVNGNEIPTEYEDSSMWDIFTGEPVEKDASDDLDDMDDMDDLDDIDDMDIWEELEEGYTKEELAEAIAKKEDALKAMDIERRRGELELQALKDSASDGIVYAKLDGVVKSAVSMDDLGSRTSKPLVVITGAEGLYISGTVSELQLDKVKKGTIVTANSWESGMTFDATVTEVFDYPVQGDTWGEGNPNVSYYRYTAYIDDSSALKNGESVDLTIQSNEEENEDGIYIEKAYVRQENGRYYVMMADENDCLKKQYVTTGKTIYGSVIEIKTGLTEEDRIAFPYGKEAIEGAKVTDAEDAYYY